MFFAEGSPWLSAKALKSLGTAESVVARSVSILTVMAVGLGVINLTRHHGAKLLRGTGGERSLSVVVLVAFVVVAAACLWNFRIDAERNRVETASHAARIRLREVQRIDSPAERDRALAALSETDWVAIHTMQSYEDAYRFEPRRFFVAHVFTPLVSTVMALLGCYITSEAYRAFRIRSLDAMVMMISAAVVIIGSDPIGGWLSALSNEVIGSLSGAARPPAIVNLPAWADFDNRVLNSGMQRGLSIGIGVAAIAVSFRILLGLERGLIEVRKGGD